MSYSLFCSFSYTVEWCTEGFTASGELVHSSPVIRNNCSCGLGIPASSCPVGISIRRCHRREVNMPRPPPFSVLCDGNFAHRHFLRPSPWGLILPLWLGAVSVLSLQFLRVLHIFAPVHPYKLVSQFNCVHVSQYLNLFLLCQVTPTLQPS